MTEFVIDAHRFKLIALVRDEVFTQLRIKVFDATGISMLVPAVIMHRKSIHFFTSQP